MTFLHCKRRAASDAWRAVALSAVSVLAGILALSACAMAAPKVIVISLDGATPWLLEQYLSDGSLSKERGIGLLRHKGAYARQNLTVAPSLTAPGHIAIATGSTAAHNDIPANTFHPSATTSMAPSRRSYCAVETRFPPPR
jgi:hypothetical protein